MLVIIHGWSDEASSFNPLARKLTAPGPDRLYSSGVRQLRLADYISLDDEIGYNDLVEAMQRAWLKEGLPTAPRSVDVVIHSTGGLLVRHWLTNYFKPETSPIKRLLMLAPANFGSPLAHTGRSMIGRAIKGWKGTRLFETGTQILKGLEIASPYSWSLAGKDIFADQQYYGPGYILCTVLVGNTGYNGISALANKPGTDGTVRVSTANLNATKIDLDFTMAQESVAITGRQDHGSTAFGIADQEDHSSIAAKDGGPHRKSTWNLIREALQVEDSDFSKWQDTLTKHNQEVTQKAERRRGSHHDSYQNTVIRVIDNQGSSVQDYVIEFFVNDDSGRRNRHRTRLIQESVVANVHAWCDDPSYRSFLVNCTELPKILDQESDDLNISITASPDIMSRPVGYRTYTDEDIATLRLDQNAIRDLFKAHRTILITIKIKRYQSDKVYQFKTIK
ncbi:MULTISPECIES: esterase/lipase family protein [Marinobacter]|uniref:esterase/lipase family protein n=1 Tax=Marinobacter TaxID=2742 RepID=UPI001B00DAB6|nr:alpha/beta hydrolase [Marinobacter sp.]MBO6812134.1 hypothetical protein [Marinobacter sp.]MBO6873618.1 hypothetical protein [Marinobacter sp.]